MKLFKDFKSKKELRKENEMLKERVNNILSRPPEIKFIEKEMNVVKASFDVSIRDRFIPIEFIKEKIAENIVREIQPAIEYDFYDGENGAKIYTGILHIATRK